MRPPWQQRVLDTALAALAEGRLGHALLLSGPAHMGKAAVAGALAARLLCTRPGPDGLACGACRGCQLFQAGTHPDLQRVTCALNDKGVPRDVIVVDQMRELAGWFQLTPQLGGAQVALIEPAHALNDAAANALLKTLEEPARNRYLLLVTERPGQLVATIRSRCQKLEFRLPPRAEGEAWLATRGGDPAARAEALEASRGHPGLAAEWLASGALSRRREVAQSLQAVGQGRASPLETATAWLADGDGELRLRFASELMVDALAARATGGRAVLTLPGDLHKLPAWVEGLDRLRGQLPVSVLRHELALAGLLLEWRKLMGNPTSQGTKR